MIKVDKNSTSISGSRDVVFTELVHAIDKFCEAVADEELGKTVPLGATVLAVTTKLDGYDLKSLAKWLKRCAKEEKNDHSDDV